MKSVPPLQTNWLDVWDLWQTVYWVSKEHLLNLHSLITSFQVSIENSWSLPTTLGCWPPKYKSIILSVKVLIDPSWGKSTGLFIVVSKTFHLSSKRLLQIWKTELNLHFCLPEFSSTITLIYSPPLGGGFRNQPFFFNSRHFVSTPRGGVVSAFSVGGSSTCERTLLAPPSNFH